LEAACGGPFAPGRLGKLERAGLLGRSAEAAAAAAKDAKAVDDGDLTSSAGNPRGGVVLTRAGGGIDPAVVQALRALVSTEQEWQEAGEAVGNFAAEINAENERKAKLAARTAMEMELGAKATTLQEDRELLQRMEKISSSEPEEKLAVQFRIEKKKLLQECIDRLR
jgi:Rubisco LSMT substrate-binding